MGNQSSYKKNPILIILSIIVVILFLVIFFQYRQIDKLRKEMGQTISAEKIDSTISVKENLSESNIKVEAPKNKKQEDADLLIQLNEDLKRTIDDLEDENFELKLFKKELDQINNNENYDTYKKELKKYIEENINNLITLQANQGSTWVVTSIYFINPFELTVYLEDGHESMQSSLLVTLQGNKIKIMEKKSIKYNEFRSG